MSAHMCITRLKIMLLCILFFTQFIFVSPNFYFKSDSHGQFLNLMENLYHYDFPSCANTAIEALIGSKLLIRVKNKIPFIATYRQKNEEGPYYKLFHSQKVHVFSLFCQQWLFPFGLLRQNLVRQHKINLNSQSSCLTTHRSITGVCLHSHLEVTDKLIN